MSVRVHRGVTVAEGEEEHVWETMQRGLPFKSWHLRACSKFSASVKQEKQSYHLMLEGGLTHNTQALGL